MTTRIFDILQSELVKRGYNEYVDKEGNLVFFDAEHQFMTKIFKYDEDVSEIVNDLFAGQSLRSQEFDQHFKKGFLFRFINRRINRQTVESFKLEMLATFLSNEDYINRVYEDAEKYITQTTTSTNKNKQNNIQVNDSSNTTDNRSAHANLPQNNIQIDVDSTIMDSASDNTISRNKQMATQVTDGETSGESSGENKSYQLNELFKSNGILDNVYQIFDHKCFMQTW